MLLQGGAGKGALFTVVVELVKVEVTLLLRDALDPDAFIPSDWQGSTAAGQAGEGQAQASASQDAPKVRSGCVHTLLTVPLHLYLTLSKDRHQKFEALDIST